MLLAACTKRRWPDSGFDKDEDEHRLAPSLRLLQSLVRPSYLPALPQLKAPSEGFLSSLQRLVSPKGFDDADCVFRSLVELIASKPESSSPRGEFKEWSAWIAYLVGLHGIDTVCRSHVGRLGFQPPTITLEWSRKTGIVLADGQATWGPDLRRELDGCTKDVVIVFLYLNESFFGGEGTGGHANALIFSPNANPPTVERFEPNFTEKDSVDKWLESSPEWKAIVGDKWKYVAPSTVCPAGGGPQKKQVDWLRSVRRLGDRHAGYCVVFAIMYMHLRLLLPRVPAEQIYGAWLSLGGEELDTLTRSYLGWMEEVLGRGSWFTDQRIHFHLMHDPQERRRAELQNAWRASVADPDVAVEALGDTPEFEAYVAAFPKRMEFDIRKERYDVLRLWETAHRGQEVLKSDEFKLIKQVNDWSKVCEKIGCK